MVLGGSVNNCSGKGYREDAACADIIGATADLYVFVSADIYCADMKMGLGDGLTGNDLTGYNAAYILADLVFLFYLKTAGEKLLFEFFGCNIYINIIF